MKELLEEVKLSELNSHRELVSIVPVFLFPLNHRINFKKVNRQLALSLKQKALRFHIVIDDATIVDVKFR
jgi:hypothetical protein